MVGSSSLFRPHHWRCNVSSGLPWVRRFVYLLSTILLMSVPRGAGAQSPATEKDELNQCVSAYKSAHYDEAIAHFRKAAELAPQDHLPKIYLATALAQNVVPGVDTPDNLGTAQQAIEVFQQALAEQPHDINSLKQIAGVYYSIRKLDEAREWQKKVLVEDPNDPEAAYTIGVIDWDQAHQNAVKALRPAGILDDGEGNAHAPVKVLGSIRDQNADLVDEGLRYLQQAIANRPDYDDAMAYMNLIYRRKADIDFEDPKARDEDLAEAKDWASKAMATRKAKEERRGAQSPQ